MRRARMTIDPGITGTGVAVWESDWSRVIISEVFLPENRPTWEETAASILGQIFRFNASIQVNCLLRISHAYCELPQSFDSSRGVAARAGRESPLIKLTMMAGMIMGWAWYEDIAFISVPVNQWKGNLSKSIVEERVKRRLRNWQDMGLKTHAFDAVGIGLYLQYGEDW